MKIGDLMQQRSALGQMGVQMPPQPMPQPIQAPQPELPGLPPELMALRPQKRDGWKNVVGTILDLVAAGSGYKPGYWSGVADEKQQYSDFEQKVALQQAEARRRLEEKRAEAALPQPPTAMERNIEVLSRLYGPKFAKQYVMKPTFVQNWDGTQTEVPTGGDAPDELPADFFGDGGPAPSAPGGFR